MTIRAIHVVPYIRDESSGPVRLTAAVGKPVVGVYSSRDYFGAWHPWGGNHSVLGNDEVHCKPCFKTEC